jgi:hypothetical protein
MSAQQEDAQLVAIFHLYPVPISFPIPLTTPITDPTHAKFVPREDTTTDHCSAAPPNGPGGTVADPKADSGYLCVYESGDFDPASQASHVFSIQPFGGGSQTGTVVDTSGTQLNFNLPAGRTTDVGTWAVTG